MWVYVQHDIGVDADNKKGAAMFPAKRKGYAGDEPLEGASRRVLTSLLLLVAWFFMLPVSAVATPLLITEAAVCPSAVGTCALDSGNSGSSSASLNIPGSFDGSAHSNASFGSLSAYADVSLTQYPANSYGIS